MGQDIIKGVYYALVLTLQNSRKIQILSRTKQRECPVGVLYTYLKYRTAIGVSVPNGNYWYRGCVIHIGVGLQRCSFLQSGQLSYEPQNVKRATVQGFTLFLCLYTTLLCITGGICSLDRIYPYGYI